MVSVKTKRDIEQLAKSVGATLEEDEEWRDMRAFQIVAPDGQRWLDGRVVAFRLDWAKGSTPIAVKFNKDAYRDLQSRIGCGMEAIPENELADYATD